MRILAVLGSPRARKSSSCNAAKHLIKGIKKAGGEVEEIFLNEYNIKHCTGCFSCWVKTPGRCIHRDDMDLLLPKIINTGMIIYAFPLYIYSTPGIVKDFLDRQIPLVRPQVIDNSGITAHPGRYPEAKRKIFLLCVAGFPELSHFDGLLLMFEKRFGTEQEKLIGKILIGAADPMHKKEFQGAFADLYKLLEQAGYELGKNGCLKQPEYF